MVRRRHRESGMVTAELAVVAPVAVSLVALLAWFVSLGHTQIQLTDAAREAARMIARGDTVAAAEQVALAETPDGTTFEVSHEDGLVVVHVTVRRTPPGRLLDDLLGPELSAEAVAALETGSP